MCLPKEDVMAATVLSRWSSHQAPADDSPASCDHGLALRAQAQSHPDVLVSSSACSPGPERVLSHVSATLGGYGRALALCSRAEPVLCV